MEERKKKPICWGYENHYDAESSECALCDYRTSCRMEVKKRIMMNLNCFGVDYYELALFWGGLFFGYPVPMKIQN